MTVCRANNNKNEKLTISTNQLAKRCSPWYWKSRLSLAFFVLSCMVTAPMCLHEKNKAWGRKCITMSWQVSGWVQVLKLCIKIHNYSVNLSLEAKKNILTGFIVYCIKAHCGLRFMFMNKTIQKPSLSDFYHKSLPAKSCICYSV